MLGIVVIFLSAWTLALGQADLSAFLNPAGILKPANFPAELAQGIQGFKFPEDGAFSKLCFKGSRFTARIGSCVAQSRCRSSDTRGSGRCARGEVCCEQNDLITGTTPRPTTKRPVGSGSSQQLVENCGKPDPNPFVFPASLRGEGPLARRRRAASRMLLQEEFRQPPITAVVGGTDVPVTSALPVGRWPWMALLGESEKGDLQWTCGGVIISATTVLTAAHCVSHLRSHPGDLTVRLGEYNISTPLDGPHMDVGVSSIIIHPEYRASQNDIAILRLAKSVTFNSRRRAVCLPAPGADHTGRRVDLAGWGRIGFHERTADVLQEVTVIVVDEELCEESYRQAGSVYHSKFPGGFQGTKICANGEDGTSRDACQGDSGGPLVAEESGRYHLIGVVSTGLGCGNPQYPGIYTKVSKYIPWIISNSS